MRDYYAELLQTKSKNMPDGEVSKVSKGQKKDDRHTFDTFDTTLSDEYQKKNVSRSQHNKFQEKINEFINRDIFFDVGINDFILTGDTQYITKEQINFLIVKAESILCNHSAVAFDEISIF